MSNPMDVFREWHGDAIAAGSMIHPDAMCVSTVDAGGEPHARFVDLKQVRDDGFVFCTSLVSPKARHIECNATVSLTFWWDHVGRQVRVLGSAARIPGDEAVRLFDERGRDAQLASWAYEQSQPLGSGATLHDHLAAARERFGREPIPRPPHWGGFIVAPRRIEFLTFRNDRSHLRVVYALVDGRWHRSQLQP